MAAHESTAVKDNRTAVDSVQRRKSMAINHTKVAAMFPEPYQGKVKKPGNWKREVTIIDAANMLELPPILKRVGDWVITPVGIHSLIIEYEIPKDSLDEPDWTERMKKKDWVNQSDFGEILRIAKDMFVLGII